jgi:hypothetical protein
MVTEARTEARDRSFPSTQCHLRFRVLTSDPWDRTVLFCVTQFVVLCCRSSWDVTRRRLPCHQGTEGMQPGRRTHRVASRATSVDFEKGLSGSRREDSTDGRAVETVSAIPFL